MRKTVLMGLGLALSIAGMAGAQGGQDAKRPHRDGKMGQSSQFERRGGPGGPAGFLLKDITLTDAQKVQLKDLRKTQHEQMDAHREAMKQQFDEARAARQRGDTAASKAIALRNRQAMEQARTQETGAIRAILTVEQRVQFDKNVAEFKTRQQERDARVGEKKGKGFRGGRPGR